MARSVLVERAITCFTSKQYDGYEGWRAEPAAAVHPAGVDVVVANLDSGLVLDPAQLGDSRDLHVAAASGGLGGVTTALCLVLASSNRGGGRGGGDFRSSDHLVGSWAGDRVGVLPVASTDGLIDISSQVRDVLALPRAWLPTA